MRGCPDIDATRRNPGASPSLNGKVHPRADRTFTGGGLARSEECHCVTCYAGKNLNTLLAKLLDDHAHGADFIPDEDGSRAVASE